jgi:hypothetical protein
MRLVTGFRETLRNRHRSGSASGKRPPLETPGSFRFLTAYKNGALSRLGLQRIFQSGQTPDKSLMNLLHLCGSASPADCLSWPLCYIVSNNQKLGIFKILTASNLQMITIALLRRWLWVRAPPQTHCSFCRTTAMAWVYILRGSTGRHYIGSTINLERRLTEHRNGGTHTNQRIGEQLDTVYVLELETIDQLHLIEGIRGEGKSIPPRREGRRSTGSSFSGALHCFSGQRPRAAEKILSTRDADALIAIGGLNDTYVAGVATILAKKPVLPFASFGGASLQLWHALHMLRRGKPTNDFRKLSEQMWNDDLRRSVSTSSRSISAAERFQCRRSRRS